MRKFVLQASCLAALSVAAAMPASAIECQGGFQLGDGHPIATPYCEDNNLASVARDYGFSVSGAGIRSHPGEMERVCRVIGQDDRVRETCERFQSER
jgi:hypothetical protein